MRRQPIALGLGCDRGTPAATLVWAVVDALASCGAALADVAAVASINLKADEPGLLELARWQGWTIHFYAAAELAAVANRSLDKAVSKGVIHKNQAANRKSAISLSVAAL